MRAVCIACFRRSGGPCRRKSCLGNKGLLEQRWPFHSSHAGQRRQPADISGAHRFLTMEGDVVVNELLSGVCLNSTNFRCWTCFRVLTVLTNDRAEKELSK